MFLKKKIFFIIFFSLLIVYFAFNNPFNKKNKISIGGSFELTNHLGEPVTDKNYEKYYKLIFFGFTNCPDFCPNTLNNIGTIIEEIKEKNKLVPIFITVDPDRDTVTKLKSYLINFHPKIVGLTGTKSQIDNVKKNYKIFSKKIMDMKKSDKDHHDNHDHGGYGVDHTTIIYLMNKKGNYLTHFNPDDKLSKIVEKINFYL